ncbi:MAG: hypothetical protein ABR605_10570, partial [Desulfurivibrionaceae bacterium]
NNKLKLSCTLKGIEKQLVCFLMPFRVQTKLMCREANALLKGGLNRTPGVPCGCKEQDFSHSFEMTAFFVIFANASRLTERITNVKSTA